MLRKKGLVKIAAERRHAQLPIQNIEQPGELKERDIKIEKNAKIIEENLKKVITDTIDHNLNTVIMSCGYILSKFQEMGSDDISVGGKSLMVDEDLATKIRFISLLNFRRILNTIKGTNEDFLDSLVVFKKDLPVLNYEKGVDLKTMLNAGIQNDFFHKVSLTSKQFDFMKENTMKGFIQFMNKNNSGLFLTDFQSDNKLRDHIIKKRLADGVVLHNDMEYQVKSKDGEIKLLKAVITRRDNIIADMREKLLKEIIHLREALFKKKQNRNNSIYRVDYFEPTEVLDEAVLKILNEKLSDMKGYYEAKIQDLQSKLAMTEKKLRYYLEMDSKDNPGYSSLLIKRGIDGIGKNPYLLWKLLQEILGREWFHKVFLERDTIKKYGIDYHAIDEIIPDLNKIIIQRRPEMIGLLAGPNALFVDMIVQTFSNQKLEAERELVNRVEFDSKITFALPQEKDILRRKDMTLASALDQNIGSGSTPVPIDHNSSGFESEGFKNIKDEIIEPQSKVSLTNPSSLNTQAKNLREQLEAPVDLNYERVVMESLDLDEIKNQNLKLKKRENMLLNELRNLQRERYVAKKRNHVLERRYDLIADFLKTVMKKMKINWEAESLSKQLLKLKDIDADSLRRAGIGRAIKKGRTDLMGKLVIHATAQNSKIEKSTNTESEEYTDLARDSDLVLWVTSRLGRMRKKKKDSSFMSRSRGKSRSRSKTGKSSNFSMRSGLNSFRKNVSKRQRRNKDQKNTSISGIEEFNQRHNRSLQPRQVMNKSTESKTDEISALISQDHRSMSKDDFTEEISVAGKSGEGQGNLDTQLSRPKTIFNSQEVISNADLDKTPTFRNHNKKGSSEEYQSEQNLHPTSYEEEENESTDKDRTGTQVTPHETRYTQNTTGMSLQRTSNNTDSDKNKFVSHSKTQKTETLERDHSNFSTFNKGKKPNQRTQKARRNPKLSNQNQQLPTRRQNKGGNQRSKTLETNVNLEDPNAYSNNETRDNFNTLNTNTSRIRKTTYGSKSNIREGEEEFSLANQDVKDMEKIKKNFDDYMDKWERKNKGKRPPKKIFEKLIKKAVMKLEKSKKQSELNKKPLGMNLMNTIEITGRMEIDNSFRQTTNFIPTGVINLEKDKELSESNPLFAALKANDNSNASLALTGMSNETMLRRNIEKARREMKVLKLRQLQREDKRRFNIDEAAKRNKRPKMSKAEAKELEEKRANEIESRLKMVFKNDSKEDGINIHKLTNLNPQNIYEESSRDHSPSRHRGGSNDNSKNVQTSNRNNEAFKIFKNAKFGTEELDSSFLPKINANNSRGKLRVNNKDYIPRYREENYKHFSPQRELSKKLRMLENSYNQANLNNHSANIHERLHNEHIVREIILNEKKVLVEKYEETKWTMNLLDQGVILYDINGVTLVYDTDTSKTYLDIRRAVKNFKDPGNKFDLEMLNRDPRPTYITELNNKILNDVKKQFYDVSSHEVESKNTNNYIPVEKMIDGEMGITLNSLSLVIHKIFNQIYGLKDRMDKKTQTNAAAAILSSIENRRKMDYLIRGVRGNRHLRKRRNSMREEHEFPNGRSNSGQLKVNIGTGKQFMTEVDRSRDIDIDIRGKSLEIQNTH